MGSMKANSLSMELPKIASRNVEKKAGISPNHWTMGYSGVLKLSLCV